MGIDLHSLRDTTDPDLKYFRVGGGGMIDVFDALIPPDLEDVPDGLALKYVALALLGNKVNLTDHVRDTLAWMIRARGFHVSR